MSGCWDLSSEYSSTKSQDSAHVFSVRWQTTTRTPWTGSSSSSRSSSGSHRPTAGGHSQYKAKLKGIQAQGKERLSAALRKKQGGEKKKAGSIVWESCGEFKAKGFDEA